MRSGLAFLPAMLAIACSESIGPDSQLALLPSFAQSLAPPVHTVTGGGQLVGADWSETYGIIAHRDADGNVRGQVEMHLVGLPAVHGTVTCLAVGGTSAWVGGVVAHSQDESVVPVGTEFWFRVQDNGQGADAPDRVSSIRLGPPAITCAEQRPVAVPWELLRGNLQVR